VNRVNRAVRQRALRERAPVAGADGFRREEFRTAALGASPVIFFICPYGTAISTVRWAIRRLGRRGYHVVAYETTTAVFMDGDPEILPGLIAAVRTDIGVQIARLTSEGVTEFGFFGSSLGSFIFYNCVGDAVPELRWGVFNTGGDIAQGMWRLDGARQAYVQRGWSLRRLEAAWDGLQWPEFGRLDGCRFVFVSSRRDTIAPLANIPGLLGPMRRAGAQVSVHEVPAIGHFTTITAGLWRAPRFVAMVRSGSRALGGAESGQCGCHDRQGRERSVVEGRRHLLRRRGDLAGFRRRRDRRPRGPDPAALLPVEPRHQHLVADALLPVPAG
jgi:hypothetical protein